jgi:SpoVK/Ycf46/Vps4 family AAA+-type ATPase
MPSVDQLAKLFRAIADGNLGQAEQVALEIAAAEERVGHHVAARSLRGSLQASRGRNGRNGTAQVARSMVLHEALTALVKKVPLAEVSLRSTIRAALDELRSEWTHRHALADSGIPRRGRLLFHGPPGCGKSLTASAFAYEIGLPVFVVRFDAVVGAYLGQTAVHLRELFHYAETVECVLLIDEVDALGRHRGDPLDVGELHRIVIALMQELEHAHPAGYVIATSNLLRELDVALLRRFDLVLEFPRPNRRELSQFARDRARKLGFSMKPALGNDVAGATSYADAEKLVMSEARRRLIARLPDAHG